MLIRGRAAQIVEAFFDDLTELDEKAQATAAGRITEALVNIGIPAARGMKICVHNWQMMPCVRVRTNKYLKTTNPNLKGSCRRSVRIKCAW